MISIKGDFFFIAPYSRYNHCHCPGAPLGITPLAWDHTPLSFLVSGMLLALTLPYSPPAPTPPQIYR